MSRGVFVLTFLSFIIISFHRTLSTGDSKCHMKLMNETGVLVSPSYPNSTEDPTIECIYDIYRNRTDFCGVKFTFDHLRITGGDENGFCTNDWISIESCVPEGGARFCGNIVSQSYEYPFQNGAEAFRILFCSDNYTEGKNFRISYSLITDCNNGLFWDPPVSLIPGFYAQETPCFTQVTEKRGTINTPYYPKPYPSEMDCVYEFIRESNYICGIKMRAIKFELDNSIETELGGACLDFFHTPGCGFLCGNKTFVWTVKFQPQATSLKFHFHSDENSTRAGFQISFEQVYNC